MESLITSLFGEPVSKAIFNSWNWLWQIPIDAPTPGVETSNDAVIEDAMQLLNAISEKVDRLQIAVDRMQSISQKIECEYNQKSQKYQELMKEALECQQSGNIVTARLTMATAIGIERILPELKIRLEHSQEMLIDINEYYIQENGKLSLLKIDLERTKSYLIMNGSSPIDRDNLNDSTYLYENLQDIENKIKDRYQEALAMISLNAGSNSESEETVTIKYIDKRLTDNRNKDKGARLDVNRRVLLKAVYRCPAPSVVRKTMINMGWLITKGPGSM